MIRINRPTMLTVAIAALGGLALSAAAALGTVITLVPAKDNTLYQDDGNLSNGRGAYLFSGSTLAFGNRRALVAFDVASGIPPGSSINSVTLRFHVSRGGRSEEIVSLYPVLANWGEGVSNAGEPGGNGAPAEPGDATWTDRIYPGTLWSQPGGDFALPASGTVTVNGSGYYTYNSAPGMVADAQSWLDSPGTNDGWIVIADEAAVANALRIDSRENPSEVNRPLLTIDYTAPAIPVGSTPNGADVPGTPLTLVSEPAGDITLDWGAACGPNTTDYGIYEGALTDFTSHVPLLCSTGGATQVTLTPGPGNRYYLIVPNNPTAEGSYGKASDGAERPASGAGCHPRAIASCP